MRQAKPFGLFVMALLGALLFSSGIPESPTITLIAPANHASLSYVPNFTFSVSEPAENCMLKIAGLIVEEIENVTPNQPYTLFPVHILDGENEWGVLCRINGTEISSGFRTLMLDRTPPNITFIFPLPSSTLATTRVNLSVETSESAVCRAGLSDKPFSALSLMRLGGARHWLEFVDLEAGNSRFYVKCRDTLGNEGGASVSLSLNPPITGAIDIDANTNPEGHYFLPAGRKPLTLKLSRQLDTQPTLYYMYEDGLRHDVALTGSGSKWYGHVIVDEKVHDRVAVFYASHNNQPIELKSGRMFIVDTQKPPAPTSLRGVVRPSGTIALEWFYSGEDVQHFRVLRAKTEDVGYLDGIATVSTTSYTDTNPPAGTLYYRISAVDMAGNEGLMSPLLKLTSSPTTKETPELSQKDAEAINLTKARLQSLALDIETARLNLNSLTAINTRKLVEDLGFPALIESRSKALETHIKKLNEAVSSKGATEALIEESVAFELETRKILPASVTFNGAAEKTQLLSEGELLQVIKEYLKLSGLSLTETQETEYLKRAVELNQLLTVKSTLEQYSLRMLDDVPALISRVERRVTHSGTERLRNIKLLEFIPTGTLSSPQELKLMSLGGELLKGTSVILWNIEELGFDGFKIEYYARKGLEQAAFDSVKTILLPPLPDETTPPQAPKLSGMPVLGLLEGSSLHSLILAAGLLLVISLSVYYFGFVNRGLQRQGDFSLNLHTNGKGSLATLVRSAHAQIDSMHYKPARLLYLSALEIIQAGETPSKAQLETLELLRSKLVLMRGIARAQSLYEKKQLGELSELLASLKPMLMTLRLNTPRPTALYEYLTRWYYHYVNLLGFSREKRE